MVRWCGGHCPRLDCILLVPYLHLQGDKPRPYMIDVLDFASPGVGEGNACLDLSLDRSRLDGEGGVDGQVQTEQTMQTNKRLSEEHRANANGVNVYSVKRCNLPRVLSKVVL